MPDVLSWMPPLTSFVGRDLVLRSALAFAYWRRAARRSAQTASERGSSRCSRCPGPMTGSTRSRSPRPSDCSSIARAGRRRVRRDRGECDRRRRLASRAARPRCAGPVPRRFPRRRERRRLAPRGARPNASRSGRRTLGVRRASRRRGVPHGRRRCVSPVDVGRRMERGGAPPAHDVAWPVGTAGGGVAPLRSIGVPARAPARRKAREAWTTAVHDRLRRGSLG